MKARIISFLEVKDKIREVVTELDRRPLNEELVLGANCQRQQLNTALMVRFGHIAAP